MPALTDTEVARLRCESLLFGDHERDSPAAIASWFGAMQAQDYASGLWSFGMRLPGWSLPRVEAAVERGEVLRTWTQRGTIHFIAAQDAKWLLRTCGSRQLTHAARRRAQLGLAEAEADQAADALGSALVGGKSLTRSAAAEVLRRAGIDASGPRLYHLTWYAAQSGVLVMGPNEGREPTYRLLEEWAPEQRDLAGDGALAELAVRYFRSHGPTTRQDLAGWAGITAAQAKTGIAAAAESLTSRTGPDGEVWLTPDLAERLPSVAKQPAPTRTPAPYDEYLLGYKDRRIPVPNGMTDRIIPGGNGVFQATIAVDGRVVATWKRAIRPSSVDVQVFALPGHPMGPEDAERHFDAYSSFLQRPARVRLMAPG